MIAPERDIAEARGPASRAANVALVWLLGFLATAGTVAVLAAWVDEPVAYLVDRLGGRPELLRELVPTPALFAPLAGLAAAAFALRRLASRPFGRPDEVLLVACISLGIGLAAKQLLKFAFGRTWPHVLMEVGVYGFFPFRVGPEYASFPSGHTAAVWAVGSVLWIWCPALRPLCLAGGILVAAALVILNYHFVGDVVAGAFLGITTTVLAVGVWNLLPRRLRADRRAAAD